MVPHCAAHGSRGGSRFALNDGAASPLTARGPRETAPGHDLLPEDGRRFFVAVEAVSRIRAWLPARRRGSLGSTCRAYRRRPVDRVSRVNLVEHHRGRTGTFRLPHLPKQMARRSPRLRVFVVPAGAHREECGGASSGLADLLRLSGVDDVEAVRSFVGRRRRTEGRAQGACFLYSSGDVGRALRADSRRIYGRRWTHETKVVGRDKNRRVSSWP